MDTGRNDNCPCGSLKKYKKCCLGRVPWDDMGDRPVSYVAQFLSVRGKNLLFLSMMAEALQLENNEVPQDYSGFKRAFTPEAVRRIYEAVTIVWPNSADLLRVLRAERGNTAGLYVGNYEPEFVHAAITRHSLYADRLLLIDPFPHPAKLRPEFNPLVDPKPHRSTTLKWAVLWFSLQPWIDRGLVAFVRSPGDFDGGAELQAIRAADALLRSTPELDKIRQTDMDRPEVIRMMERYQRQTVLSTPTEVLLRDAKAKHPEWTDAHVDAFLRGIEHRRLHDPYFIEPFDLKGGSELMQFSTGAPYELAKLMAAMSGSFLLTDLNTRWKEIELDRKAAGIDSEGWSPFAQSFGGLPLRYLEQVPLKAALTIREEERLGALRGFLRKVWQSNAGDNPFDTTTGPLFEAELNERIREAEHEWQGIDKDLLKWFGSEMAIGTASVLATGSVASVGAGLAIAGLSNLVLAGWSRSTYENRFPAAFFLRLQNQEFK